MVVGIVAHVLPILLLFGYEVLFPQKHSFSLIGLAGLAICFATTFFGYLAMVLGSAHYARAKGYSRLIAVPGLILPFFGYAVVIIVFMLPNKLEQQER